MPKKTSGLYETNASGSNMIMCPKQKGLVSKMHREAEAFDSRANARQLLRRLDIEGLIIRENITVRDLSNFIVSAWGLPVHPLFSPVQLYAYEDRLVAFSPADFSEEQFLCNPKITLSHHSGADCILTAEQFGTLLGLAISREIITHCKIGDKDDEILRMHKNSYSWHIAYRQESLEYQRYQN